MNRIHTAFESLLEIDLADPALAAYLRIEILALNRTDAILFARRKKNRIRARKF